MPGRWPWGGRAAAECASQFSWGARPAARDVPVPTNMSQETGTWALGYANCADDIPAVLPLEWALLLEINGLLLLPPARCTALGAGEVEDCVLHWHFEAFSFWFEVGAVRPAGSGTLLHPPVGPSPCSRAALWQELKGEEHVKTTRFPRRQSGKRESSCLLPSQPRSRCNHQPVGEEFACSK